MTFLSPLFLFGAAAAAIPVVLHFLHRQPEPRVKFAAVHLLRQAPVEDTRSRRLREWLLLALRVAALVLMAAAFARPYFLSASARTATGVTVVALDTSMSMSGPRFAKAQATAKDAIEKAPANARVGVVIFAGHASGVVKPTTDRAVAISAIDGAVPGFGATHYRAALGAAAQMIEGAGGAAATILVVTDLQASGWDAGDRAAVPEKTSVQVADVGAPGANLAITDARLAGDRLVATVRSTDSAPREVRVHLAVDGKADGDAAATLGPGQSADLDFPAPHGDGAVVSIDDPHGLQGDNVRYLVLGSASRPAILVVTTNGDLARDAFYVQQALSSSPAYQVTGVPASGVGSLDKEKVAAATVVLLSTRELDARGRAALSAFVKGGGGLFIAAGPDVDAGALEEILGGAAVLETPSSGAHDAPARTFAPIDLRHPVFQAFGGQASALSLVRFRQISVLAAKSCATLATFTTGEAALVDCGVGNGRALVFASDVDHRGNDFPSHPTFVPFLNESIRYLGSGRTRSADVLVGEVAGVRDAPGFADERDPQTGRSRRVAVNVDPGESDPGRVTPAEFEQAVTTLREAGRSEAALQASERESQQHVWQYLLLLAMGVLAGESVLSTRAA